MNRTREEEEALIKENLPLIHKLVRRFCRTQPWERENALCDALLGALTAIRTWDPDRSKLTSWLGQKVVRTMIDGWRERDYLSRIQRARGTGPVIHSLNRQIRRGKGLYNGEWNDGGAFDTFLVSHEEKADAALESAEGFERLLKGLNYRDKELLRYLFRDGKSQKEAAELLGLSPSRVSQRLSQLLAELRERVSS